MIILTLKLHLNVSDIQIMVIHSAVYIYICHVSFVILNKNVLVI